MALPLSPTIGDEYTEDGLTRVCVGVSPNRWISKRQRPPLFTSGINPHADARGGDGWTDPVDGRVYEFNGIGWIGSVEAPELFSEADAEPTLPVPKGFRWHPPGQPHIFTYSENLQTWIG